MSDKPCEWTKHNPYKAGWYWVIDGFGNIKIEHVWIAGPRESSDYLAVGNERIEKIKESKHKIVWWLGPIEYPRNGPPKNQEATP